MTSLIFAAMCFEICLPDSVVDCPIRLSKNLQPGFNIAPYSEFKLIFLTSCLLSQNSSSALFFASLDFFNMDCISCLSVYQRFSSPGITPSNSLVKIVPLALNIIGLLLSKINLYTSAPLIISVFPSSQSTCIEISLRISITASYSNEPK